MKFPPFGRAILSSFLVLAADGFPAAFVAADGGEEKTEAVQGAPAAPIRLAVGITGRLKNVVLPGPKRASRPIDRAAPCVVRIDAVYPHGEAWRYDLSFFGFEPGRYNLVDYLVAADGSPAGKVAPIWVEVYSVLPSDRTTPHEIPPGATPRPSRYRTWIVVAGVVWFVGLLGLLFAGRIRRTLATSAETRRPTLADRLRPLVRKAEQGDLTSAEQAELERLLISFWQRKLELHEATPAETMARLRSHDEAGALLRQLEVWLHHPQRQAPADLEALLAPYRNVREPEPAHDA